MRVKETIIRPFGNSAGVTIPKAMLDTFSLAKGDKVSIHETADGILITPYDQLFDEAMTVYREGARKYRNAMRELSKR